MIPNTSKIPLLIWIQAAAPLHNRFGPDILIIVYKLGTMAGTWTSESNLLVGPLCIQMQLNLEEN